MQENITNQIEAEMELSSLDPRLMVVSGKKAAYSGESMIRCTRRLNFEANEAE